MPAVKTLTAKPDAEVRVPPLTDYPAYVQVRDRLYATRRDLAAAEKEVQDERRLHLDREKALDAMAQKALAAQQAPGEAARAALVEEGQAAADARARKTGLENKITLLRRMVEQQEQTLMKTTREVSQEINRALQGPYQDLTRKMIEHTVQALLYSCQLQQILDALEQGGVNPRTLDHAGIGDILLGDVRQQEAGIHMHVKHLIDRGLLNGEESSVRSLRAMIR
jgi:hypothetical protein